MVAQRETDGRQPLEAAFLHHTHGAGIVDVDRRIVAVIDATHHQVGLSAGQFEQSQLDAVGRRSRATVHGQTGFLAYQVVSDWHLGRNGSRHTRARSVGSHDYQFAQWTEKTNQFVQAFGLIAIVVGNQNQGFVFFFHIYPFCVPASHPLRHNGPTGKRPENRVQYSSKIPRPTSVWAKDGDAASTFRPARYGIIAEKSVPLPTV